MSSYSANALCIGPSQRTALITIGGELTCRSAKTHRSPEEYSLQQRVLWWSFVKWAVCIITTNAAPPNTHPIRRQHRIECRQKIRRLRVVVRRRRDLCTTRHFDEPSRLTCFRPRLVLFGFFVGTVAGKPIRYQVLADEIGRKSPRHDLIANYTGISQQRSVRLRWGPASLSKLRSGL